MASSTRFDLEPALAAVGLFVRTGHLPGDYNGDRIVDAGDYAIWRKTNIFRRTGYTAWRHNFGKDYNWS